MQFLDYIGELEEVRGKLRVLTLELEGKKLLADEKSHVDNALEEVLVALLGFKRLKGVSR